MRKQLLSIIAAGLMLGGVSQIKAMGNMNSSNDAQIAEESLDERRDLFPLPEQIDIEDDLFAHNPPYAYFETHLGFHCVSMGILLGSDNNQTPQIGVYYGNEPVPLIRTEDLPQKQNAESNIAYNSRVRQYIHTLFSRMTQNDWTIMNILSHDVTTSDNRPLCIKPCQDRDLNLKFRIFYGSKNDPQPALFREEDFLDRRNDESVTQYAERIKREQLQPLIERVTIKSLLQLSLEITDNAIR